MIAGFHTAGLLLHDVCTAVEELAGLGYRCVAIRPHAASFEPGLPQFGLQVVRIANAIATAGVQAVIDLDGLYLQDPRQPRGHSLVAADDQQCLASRNWIAQWAGIAEELGASIVTFSSGAAEVGEFAAAEQNLERLSIHLNQLLEQTSGGKVRLAIRPRSGDAIATVAHFERLTQWLGQPARLGLAADVGEMLAGGELPVGDRLARNLDSLACVYLCDHRAGTAGDQRIGHGDVALTRILVSLDQYGFAGPAIVRIEGHCELGFTPAGEAIQIFTDAQSAVGKRVKRGKTP